MLVNIEWKITQVTREELNIYLEKNTETNYFIIKDEND